MTVRPGATRTLDRVEILLWLLPAAVVTLATMLWVAWWGRDGRGVVDRETAARRLGEALSEEPRHRPGYAAVRRTPDRSTGVAVRPSRTRPVVLPPIAPTDGAGDADRRAS